MRVNSLLFLSLMLVATNAQNNNNKQDGQTGQNSQNDKNANNNAALSLDSANIQKASQSDGLSAGKEAGQAASATDSSNFINFCSGKTLTNGLQVKTGSCNGIVMGDIPAIGQMISAIIIEPKDGDVRAPDTSITFSVKITNLQAGSFTNPNATYYAAPQALKGGQVVGHTHISVQDMGGTKNPNDALDAQKFAFFKGIDDAGDGKGTLSTTLEKGLPEGIYRVCSITSASNHQPVVMPVAQRGPQDDCIRFEVSADGAGGAGTGNNQQGQGQQGQKGQAQPSRAQISDSQLGQGRQIQTSQVQPTRTQTSDGQQEQSRQSQKSRAQPTQTQTQTQTSDNQQGQGRKGQKSQIRPSQTQANDVQQDQRQQGQDEGEDQGSSRRDRGRGQYARLKFAARDFVA